MRATLSMHVQLQSVNRTSYPDKSARHVLCVGEHMQQCRDKCLMQERYLLINEPYKLSTEPYILIKVCDTYYIWVCTCRTSEKSARLVCACACVLLLLKSLQFMNSQRERNCLHNPFPRILQMHLEVDAWK